VSAARFLLMRPPPAVTSDGTPTEQEPTEYIELRVGVDVVCRRATDADRAAHASEYAAFKAPAATIVVDQLAEHVIEAPRMATVKPVAPAAHHHEPAKRGKGK
jgi:hypothetical protein